MATYDLRDIGNDFVVHYGGDDTAIDAFTFANSLTSLGQALQEINKEINPGFALEVSVVALGGGSFRPQLKARAKRLVNLLVGDVRQGVVSTFIGIMLLRLFGWDAETTTVIVVEDGATVEIHNDSGDVIILPREVYESSRRVQDNPEVDRHIRQNFETLEEDEAVTSFGVARNPAEFENMPIHIDRNQFGEVARPRLPASPNQRYQVMPDQELQILRAIFEDSARRWQFVWHGMRISAPVLD